MNVSTSSIHTTTADQRHLGSNIYELCVPADLGFDDMGFRMELNGQPAQIDTKNVDKLAREGVVLDAYYVQCVCSPSRVTFLT